MNPRDYSGIGRDQLIRENEQLHVQVTDLQTKCTAQLETLRQIMAFVRECDPDTANDIDNGWHRGSCTCGSEVMCVVHQQPPSQL